MSPRLGYFYSQVGEWRLNLPEMFSSSDSLSESRVFWILKMKSGFFINIGYKCNFLGKLTNSFFTTHVSLVSIQQLGFKSDIDVDFGTNRCSKQRLSHCYMPCHTSCSEAAMDGNPLNSPPSLTSKNSRMCIKMLKLLIFVFRIESL